jgi:hypothetical protein
VLYRCVTTDGKEFCNTEFFTFKDDQLREVQVYFGAGYKNGQFVKQQS